MCWGGPCLSFNLLLGRTLKAQRELIDVLVKRLGVAVVTCLHHQSKLFCLCVFHLANRGVFLPVCVGVCVMEVEEKNLGVWHTPHRT